MSQPVLHVTITICNAKQRRLRKLDIKTKRSSPLLPSAQVATKISRWKLTKCVGTFPSTWRDRRRHLFSFCERRTSGPGTDVRHGILGAIFRVARVFGSWPTRVRAQEYGERGKLDNQYPGKSEFREARGYYWFSNAWANCNYWTTLMGIDSVFVENVRRRITLVISREKRENYFSRSSRNGPEGTLWAVQTYLLSLWLVVRNVERSPEQLRGILHPR